MFKKSVSVVLIAYGASILGLSILFLACVLGMLGEAHQAWMDSAIPKTLIIAVITAISGLTVLYVGGRMALKSGPEVHYINTGSKGYNQNMSQRRLTIMSVALVTFNPWMCVFLVLAVSILVLGKQPSPNTETLVLLFAVMGSLMLSIGAWFLLAEGMLPVADNVSPVGPGTFLQLRQNVGLGLRCAYLTVIFAIISIIMPVFASLPAVGFGVAAIFFFKLSKTSLKFAVWIAIIFSILTALVMPILGYVAFILAAIH